MTNRIESLESLIRRSYAAFFNSRSFHADDRITPDELDMTIARLDSNSFRASITDDCAITILALEIELDDASSMISLFLSADHSPYMHLPLAP